MLRSLVVVVTLLAGLSAVEGQEWQPKFFLQPRFVSSMNLSANGDLAFVVFVGGVPEAYLVDITGDKEPKKISPLETVKEVGLIKSKKKSAKKQKSSPIGSAVFSPEGKIIGLNKEGWLLFDEKGSHPKQKRNRGVEVGCDKFCAGQDVFFTWSTRLREKGDRSNTRGFIIGYDGTKKGTVYQADDIQCAAISPDGNWVYTASSNHQTGILEVLRTRVKSKSAPRRSGESETEHSQRVARMNLQQFRLPKVTKVGEVTFAADLDLRIGNTITSLAVNDEKVVVAVNGGKVCIVNVDDEKMDLPTALPGTEALSYHSWQNVDVALSEGGHVVLSRTGWRDAQSKGMECEVVFWRNMAEQPTVLRGHDVPVMWVGFLDSHTFFSVDIHGNVGIWDENHLDSPQWFDSDTNATCYDAIASPNGATIAVQLHGVGIQTYHRNLPREGKSVTAAKTSEKKVTASSKK